MNTRSGKRIARELSRLANLVLERITIMRENETKLSMLRGTPAVTSDQLLGELGREQQSTQNTIEGMESGTSQPAVEGAERGET